MILLEKYLLFYYVILRLKQELARNKTNTLNFTNILGLSDNYLTLYKFFNLSEFQFP